MAGTLDGILASRRADGRDVTALSMRLLSTSLPLLVGVVLALPLAMLLANSFNVSAAGQPARFGFANWQAAVADPSAVGALWNSFALAIVRTAISLVLSVESFEVELLLGAPVHLYVYSTRIYDLVNNQPSNVGEATAMAVVFLVWLLLLTWLYRRAIGGRSYTTVTGRDYASRPILLGRWGWVALGMCLTYFILAIAAPLAMLVAGSFMRLYGFF